MNNSNHSFINYCLQQQQHAAQQAAALSSLSMGGAAGAGGGLPYHYYNTLLYQAGPMMGAGGTDPYQQVWHCGSGLGYGTMEPESDPLVSPWSLASLTG